MGYLVFTFVSIRFFSGSLTFSWHVLVWMACNYSSVKEFSLTQAIRSCPTRNLIIFLLCCCCCCFSTVLQRHRRRRDRRRKGRRRCRHSGSTSSRARPATPIRWSATARCAATLWKRHRPTPTPVPTTH